MARFCFHLALFFVISASLPALAWHRPPGIYHSIGRVVQLSDGSVTIFRDGAPFAAEQQQKLRPHLGAFVHCEYLRVADKSPLGSSIGPIQKITTIARTPADLPVVVHTKATKPDFRINEPIEIEVELHNQSAETQKIHNLMAGWTILCQDYDEKLRLESDQHYDTLESYDFMGVRRPEILSPGERVRYRVRSSRMAEPGIYQAVHFFSLGPRYSIAQSEFEKITVLPADAVERNQALRSWQPIASRDQSITITEELARLDDQEAVSAFLDQLKAGRYTPRGYCYDTAYELAFQIGGKAGADTMMELITIQGDQDRIGRMLPGIIHAANRLDLLAQLLENQKPLMKGLSGWVDEPRICDITAAWLAGYTETIKFPRNGTAHERDETVKAVLTLLKEQPDAFRLLRKDYQ